MPEINSGNVTSKINEVKLKGFTEKYWTAHFASMKKTTPVVKAIKSLKGVGLQSNGSLTNLKKAVKAKGFYLNLKSSIVAFSKANTKKNDPLYKVCKTYLDITSLQLGKLDMHLAIAEDDDELRLEDDGSDESIDEEALLLVLKDIRKQVKSSATVCSAFHDRVQGFISSAEEALETVRTSEASNPDRRAALAAYSIEDTFKELAVTGERRTLELSGIRAQMPDVSAASDALQAKGASLSTALNKQLAQLVAAQQSMGTLRTAFRTLKTTLSGAEPVSLELARTTLLALRTELSSCKTVCDAFTGSVNDFTLEVGDKLDRLQAADTTDADKLAILTSYAIVDEYKRLSAIGERRTLELLNIYSRLPNINGLTNPKLTKLNETVLRRYDKLSNGMHIAQENIGAIRTRFRNYRSALQ